MKLVFRNISLLLLSFLVVFLSVGVTISKMACCTDKISFGLESPKCGQEEKELICKTDIIKQSCCQKLNDQESCCAMGSNMCVIDLRELKFDFETIIPFEDIDFEIINKSSYIIYHYDFASSLLEASQFDSSVLQLTKRHLSMIQSFLL